MKIRPADAVERLTITRPRAVSDKKLPTVLICPGGGYGQLAPHESEPVAVWANELGFAAAVLRYRVAPDAGHPNPLNDALDAMRTLRRSAGEWGLSGKIAVLGFSAGGHLAASLSVLGSADAETRPDASVLVYPVITMLDPHTHAGSRENLLGPGAAAEAQRAMSWELHVSSNTPPAFLVHGWDDTSVPVENALAYAHALRVNGVPFELHVYPHGPHGFGMGGERLPPGSPIGDWPKLAGTWLRNLFFPLGPQA